MQQVNKCCPLKNSPLLHVNLPGGSAQEETRVLSLEPSQEENEWSKGTEHRVAPATAWRKAKAHGWQKLLFYSAFHIQTLLST